MKKVQSFLLAIVLAALFVSCQSGTDAKLILSNSDTRKEIMNTIANDSLMHQQMMAAMMDSKNGMMMGDHASMMKMIKLMQDNPHMVQGMMDDMMETSKSDTAMMSGMCKSMMANPQMMDMMNKMKAGNMDMDKMKMDNKKTMDTIQDHKLHH